jgi:hypothetical protein
MRLSGRVQDLAPLFGPVREKEWSPEWSPTFAHPSTPAQEEGVVFWTVTPHGRALWTLTEYAPDEGRIGYVVVIPDYALTDIKIRLVADGDAACVTVSYRRSALTAAANGYVDEFAKHFAAEGPHWQAAIARTIQAGSLR